MNTIDHFRDLTKMVGKNKENFKEMDKQQIIKYQSNFDKISHFIEINYHFRDLTKMII